MTRRSNLTLLASCAAVYLLVATRLSDGLLRRQFANGAYSHFFDYQAEALRRGHLALPRGAIGIEAFVVDGREQMYFGIFPAIIRMPILQFTDALFGDLTLLSSFAAWLVFVLSAWALADMALPLLAPDVDERVRWWAALGWKVTVGLGSPMLMLAGPAWVFSEAIMWATAISLLFQYRLLCEIRASSTRNQLLLGATLLLAVLNRPTHALGCLAVLVALVGIRAVRARSVTRGDLILGAATMVSAVVMVIPNWLRFHRIYGLPMDAHRITQVEEYRREMLAYAGNDYTDLRYLPSNVLAYLRPDGISVSSRFPFVNAPRDIPTVFFDAVYDITNRTPSIAASSPLLFGLTIIGLIVGVATVRTGGINRQLGLLAAVGIPATGAHLVWGFINGRFLADFLPLMLPLGLIGLGSVTAWSSRGTSRRRRWSLIGGLALVAWSVTANVGLALGTSYFTGYDGDVDEYVALQGRSDFWSSESSVRHPDVTGFQFGRDDPPAPDTIAILGDCAAAYISNGEQVDPWLSLGYGVNDFRREYSVTLPENLPPVSIPLATFSAADPADPSKPAEFHVRLVTDPDGSTRLELADEFGFVPYPLDVEPGAEFVLAITSDPVRRVMSFDVDGTTVAYGHDLTRSLYDEGGQIAEFSDEVSQSGVDVAVVDPEQPC